MGYKFFLRFELRFFAAPLPSVKESLCFPEENANLYKYLFIKNLFKFLRSMLHIFRK